MGGEGGADVAGAESGFVRWRGGGLGLWVVGDVWMGDGGATGMGLRVSVGLRVYVDCIMGKMIMWDVALFAWFEYSPSGYSLYVPLSLVYIVTSWKDTSIPNDSPVGVR